MSFPLNTSGTALFCISVGVIKPCSSKAFNTGASSHTPFHCSISIVGDYVTRCQLEMLKGQQVNLRWKCHSVVPGGLPIGTVSSVSYIFSWYCTGLCHRYPNWFATFRCSCGPDGCSVLDQERPKESIATYEERKENSNHWCSMVGVQLRDKLSAETPCTALSSTIAYIQVRWHVK